MDLRQHFKKQKNYVLNKNCYVGMHPISWQTIVINTGNFMYNTVIEIGTIQENLHMENAML